MKKAIGKICFGLLWLLPFLAKAQTTHFIFIQADDKQRFSVMVNNSTYNSTEGGYVVVPKLNDGMYQLSINFLESKLPAVQFNCAVNNADGDYALKNLRDKGWVLLNMQTLEITVPGATAAKPQMNSDAFADMLSTVVNDTALTQNMPAKETNESESQAVAIDTISTAKTDTAKVSADSLQTTKQVQAIVDVQVDKIKDTSAMDLAVAEKKETAAADSLPEKIVENKTESSGNPFYKKADTVLTEKNIAMPAIKKTEEAAAPVVPEKKTSEKSCAKMLSDNDMEKLRKKMFTTSGDDKMIEAANKSFSGKCVTTEQVKLLSSYFLSDEGRFNFFSAAYTNIVDAANFANLEKLLIDPVYKTKFRELIK